MASAAKSTPRNDGGLPMALGTRVILRNAEHGGLDRRAAASPSDAAATAPANLGPLPEWDLADLYPGPDSPELARDLAALAADAALFRDRHRGKLADLSGTELAAAIREYERQ